MPMSQWELFMMLLLLLFVFDYIAQYSSAVLFYTFQALIFASQGPDAHESMGAVYDAAAAVCV